MSLRRRRGVHHDGIMLVVYGLPRLFENKGCGKATMAGMATTHLRGAGG